MPLIKGGECAKSIRKEIEQNCLALKAEGVAPKLAILRVGQREDDIAYERSAMKKAEQMGIEVRHVVLEEQSSTAQCLQAVQALNDDPSVHGILLFRPLPRHIEEERVVESLLSEKDIDGMTRQNLAKVFVDDQTGFAPCTAEAVVRLLAYEKIELQGKNIAVIGRSLVVGKPLSMLLLHKNATVTLCHSKTAHLPEVCANADILVAAVGRAKMVNRHYVKPGAVVVDVGINVDETGALCGDVDTQDVEKTAAVTPVPGGLGGVTSWLLLEHVVRAAQMRRK